MIAKIEAYGERIGIIQKSNTSRKYLAIQAENRLQMNVVKLDKQSARLKEMVKYSYYDIQTLEDGLVSHNLLLAEIEKAIGSSFTLLPEDFFERKLGPIYSRLPTIKSGIRERIEQEEASKKQNWGNAFNLVREAGKTFANMASMFFTGRKLF